MRNKKIEALRALIAEIEDDSECSAQENGTYLHGVRDALELLETGKITSRY